MASKYLLKSQINDIKDLEHKTQIDGILSMINKSNFIKNGMYNCYERYVIICELIRNPEEQMFWKASVLEKDRNFPLIAKQIKR